MFLEHDEMKFAILYTLEKNAAPIAMPALCDILTWEKQVMNYFDLALMLNELIEDGFVESKFYRDERCFTPSEKGSETNTFFFERVPLSIRNKIDAAISEIKFEEQTNPNAVMTEVIPVAAHQYMASLNMLDANLPLLELKIHAGSRADAESAAKQLSAHADEIYKDIIEKIMPKKAEN